MNNTSCPWINFDFKVRFLPPVYISVFIFGLLHNWTKLKIINVFIINRGLTYMLHLLTLLTLVVYHMKSERIVGNSAFCKITRFCFNLNLYGSIWFLTCISVYRYLAIVHPMRVMGRITLIHSVTISVMVWLLVSVQCFPDMFYPKIFENSTGKCFDTTSMVIVDDYLKYSLGWTLTGFCIHSRHMSVILWTMKSTDKVQKQRSLKLLLILIILFSVCYIPYHVLRNLNLWSRVLVRRRTCHGWLNRVYVAWQVSHSLVCLNSGLNPVFYLHGNDNILVQLRQLLQQGHQMVSSLTNSGCV
ncbi:P2Y purinoceptor 1-like [Chaetodon trifascialis]|uniref:P2Y purinoceptor 1-like n=1 Tax=Chaetodon trifascialis TaxID=109706 RepID=UPI0039964A7E